MLTSKNQTFDTAAQALTGAGLDWSVGLEMLKTASGLNVPGFMASVRTDTSAILGVVGERYVPIQNASAFAFLDGIVGERKASIVGAGSFKGGRLVYIQYKLEGEIVLPGKSSEVLNKFLTLTTSHDGSGALNAFFTSVRIVCQNTFRAALKQATTNRKAGVADMVSVRHTANATMRANEAQKVLGLSYAYFDAFRDMATQLVQTPYTDRNMVELATVLAPADSDGDVSTRTKGIREDIQALFTGGKGHSAIQGTAWAAVNAVTEYVDHHRGTRVTGGQSVDESRTESAWFGSGKLMKDAAFTHILTQTGLRA